MMLWTPQSDFLKKRILEYIKNKIDEGGILTYSDLIFLKKVSTREYLVLQPNGNNYFHYDNIDALNVEYLSKLADMIHLASLDNFKPEKNELENND